MVYHPDEGSVSQAVLRAVLYATTADICGCRYLFENLQGLDVTGMCTYLHDTLETTLL